MPDSPLEVGLGVSLDEGVDGANTSVGLGGVVGGRQARDVKQGQGDRIKECLCSLS